MIDYMKTIYINFLENGKIRIVNDGLYVRMAVSHSSLWFSSFMTICKNKGEEYFQILWPYSK